MNTFDYPGSAANFRAFMEGTLGAHEGGVWVLSSTERIAISYETALSAPAREGWHIFALTPQDDGRFHVCQRRATLLALEVLPNATVAYVYDGILYESMTNRMQWEPVGSGLDVVLDELVSRISKQATTISRIPRKPASRNLEEWFDYRSACDRIGTKVTLRSIADSVSYNYDYVRQRHLEYKRKKLI